MYEIQSQVVSEEAFTMAGVNGYAPSCPIFQDAR